MPDEKELIADDRAPTDARREAIKDFLARLPIDIHDISDQEMNRYELAFTHKSVWGKDVSYERLEFLGDRVLNLIAASYLFNKPDRLSPGCMTNKMECVTNDNLEEFIEKKSLFSKELILTGKGTIVTPNMRADIFEALIGAIYLHKGFETADCVIRSIFEPEIDSFDPDRNNKGRLQETCQRLGLPLPIYEDISEDELVHTGTFHSRVRIGAEVRGEGTGLKKIMAHQEAAGAALRYLENNHEN